jgi:hypothetical protein
LKALALPKAAEFSAVMSFAESNRFDSVPVLPLIKRRRPSKGENHIFSVG